MHWVEIFDAVQKFQNVTDIHHCTVNQQFKLIINYFKKRYESCEETMGLGFPSVL